MSYSPVFKWFIVLLIPLTLGWKLTAVQQFPIEQNDKVVEFLLRHKFNANATERVFGTSIIHATTNGCRMAIAEVWPNGANRDIIRDLFKTMDHHFMVFRGRIYVDLPNWLTAAHQLWSRYLDMIGVVHHETRVIAVGTTEHCDAERLPWNELHETADLPRTNGPLS